MKYILKLALKYRLLIYPAITTLIWGIIILPYNSSIAFVRPQNICWYFISIALKLSYLAILYIFTLLIFYFIRQYRERTLLYVQWSRYFLIYLAIMLGFFLVLYPGHWIGDEFHILQAVKEFNPYSWQHYFTNIFYTYCLFTIPTGVSIVLFQIITISIIVSYIMARTRELSNKRFAPWVLMTVFLLPPILINDFYPLRLTIYSYLSALALFEIYRLHRKSYTITNKHIYLIIFSFIVMLLSFWRTEGLIYLLLVPYLFIRFGLWRFRPIILSTLTTASCIGILLTGFMITRATYSPLYDITAFVNPLSQMLQAPLMGNKTPEKLAIIDKVISIDALRQHPSADEIPAFWTPNVVRDDYSHYLDSAKKAFLYIVINNPIQFFKAKIKTFLSANGFSAQPPLTEGLLALDNYSVPQDELTVKTFHETNIASETINKPLKRFVTRTLLFQDSNRMSWLGYPIWSIIIPAIILLGLFVYYCCKKTYLIACLPAILLINAAFVFISAPANYFMYYLPLYMNSYIMIVIASTATPLLKTKRR